MVALELEDHVDGAGKRVRAAQRFAVGAVAFPLVGDDHDGEVGAGRGAHERRQVRERVAGAVLRVGPQFGPFVPRVDGEDRELVLEAVRDRLLDDRRPVGERLVPHQHVQVVVGEREQPAFLVQGQVVPRSKAAPAPARSRNRGRARRARPLSASRSRASFCRPWGGLRSRSRAFAQPCRRRSSRARRASSDASPNVLKGRTDPRSPRIGGREWERNCWGGRPGRRCRSRQVPAAARAGIPLRGYRGRRRDAGSRNAPAGWRWDTRGSG